MNSYTFNKKWGKYGYKYYTVKLNGKIVGELRNVIYVTTVCRNMTADECDEYLTKNRHELECNMAKQLEQLIID